MSPSGESDSRVWVNPLTGGVESTLEWQRRLNAGDPEAHRQLAALGRTSPRSRLTVHPDVAKKFITQAIHDGAEIPNPPELDGAFRLALTWAYSRLGGDARRF